MVKRKRKYKCIDARPHNDVAGNPQLVLGQVYEAITDEGGRPIIDGRTWGISRFKDVTNDEDYEPVPVTLKSPSRAANNHEESQELMDFFSRPQPGNCKCGGPKSECPYHKGTK